MTVQWDDDVDDIITGDAAAGCAYVTPARGVVIFPMAPMGLRDREARTITVTPQAPPKNGTGPRVPAEKAAGHVARLPHSLLGWVGVDGLPMVARVTSAGADERGVRLTTSDGALPPGGRCAGLTSDAFKRYMIGQEQLVHTGWLEVDDDVAVYAPHTKAGHAMPASKRLMAVATALTMPRGYREARKLGLVS